MAFATHQPGRILPVLLAGLSLAVALRLDAAAPTVSAGQRGAQQLSYPVHGPALEEVPGPAVAGDVPAPATWKCLRHEQPLRALVIVSKGRPLASYQRICRRLRAGLEVRYANAGDARYHVNDKWIEPKDNPTNEELTACCRELILEAVKPGAAPLPYDVIFCDHTAGMLGDVALGRHLLALAEAGGVVVFSGSEYPPKESPLAAVWPARPTRHNSWMSGGAKREQGPELAGVPLDRLTGHAWIPIPEAADGARALAVGEAGAMFARAVGRGTLLFVPTGPLSRAWDLHARLGRTLDHDEIWLRAWDQVLHTLRGGPPAVPAYADLRVEPPTDAAAGQFKLTVRVVNRAVTGQLAAGLHVTSPQGEVVYRRDVPLTVAPGAETSLDLALPVPDRWGGGLYPVYFTLGDAEAKKQLHQAMDFLPVRGAVSVEVTSKRRGYRLGEEAALAVAASSREPWQGTLLLGVYDFRGRLLAQDEKSVRLSTEPLQESFSWRLADHGVRVDTFRAVVAAVRDGTEYARAEVKFCKYEPWSMHNEYQWSTWAGIACGSPCAVPAGMRLMAHAGMNSLGYPGQNELSFAAERWGWRYYNEGIGMNTFSPVIEYENDAEIEAYLTKEAERHLGAPDLVSATFVIGSVGEEAGYKHGWGTKYYWETPVAPEKACRAFQWYLKTKYGELARLNATWRTKYRAWEEVKLTREFSGPPPKLEADGWARPKESPLGAGATAVSLAPYADTEHFYAWYYDRIIAAAGRIFRGRINPVARTVASAPSSWVFASRECDVRLAGPSAWNESQWHSLAGGPEPAFGLVWGHFDWSVKTENLFWGFLLQRCGHNDYWVDVPLMFNNDMSHTRASMAMRRWTARLAGHERLVLDSRPAPSDCGVLDHNGISADATPGNMHKSLCVALLQSGYGYARAEPADLARYKVVFAPLRQSVSRSEADALDDYVRGGGLLVFTARLASQDEFGAPQRICPGGGLSERWGLTVTEKVETIPRYGHAAGTAFPLDRVDASLRGFVVEGRNLYREKVKCEGWTELAAYADGTPALLARKLGRGRLVYLNAVYQSHWYIQWVTPTGPERQGFYKLVEWLCGQAGARRTLKLEGDLQQVLHVAVKQFTDATGAVRYVLVRTSGEVPWTGGRLRWLGPGEAVYNVLSGPGEAPARVLGREVPLHLRPGDGRLLAVLARRLEAVRVWASPRITAGQPLRVKVDLADASGRPLPGAFPLEIRVTRGGQEIAGLRRSVSLESGGSATLVTALSDPAGPWTVVVTDGITGLSGSAAVEVAPPKRLRAPGFVSLGWPSELAEPAPVSPAEFLDRLRRLSLLYQTDHSGQGWKVKQLLGAYYDFFPGTRHSLLRPLYDVDWSRYVDAWRKVLQGGQTLILTGEDVNLDPATGLAVWPEGEGHPLRAVAAVLHDARWRLGTADGDTLVAALGKGRMILCRESIDAAGHTNADTARWQQRWLAELASGATGLPEIPALDEAALVRWWGGEMPAADVPRAVRWFAGNYGELTLALEPAKALDSVFGLVLPPQGKVESISFEATAQGQGTLSFDVGCDDAIEGTLAASDSSGAVAASEVAKWADVVTRYLARRAQDGGSIRDGNSWRIVPVRVRSTGRATLTLRRLELRCQ